MTATVAKTYSGIRDVTTYIGESSPGKRWPGGPWRASEWAAIAVITGPTIFIVDYGPTGTTLPTLIIGAVLLAVVLVGMRLFLPKHRPSLLARATFAWHALRPEHGVFEAPTKVAANIVFTEGGVYAEYLFDGISSALDSEPVHAGAAELTRNLARYLPSGSMVRGLLVAEDTFAIMRSMIGAHADKPEWIRQCRAWEPHITNPTRAPLDDDDVFRGPVRQRFWLSIPVDCGTAGRTRLGQGKQAWDWIAGRDKDSNESIVDYAATAAAITAGLPRDFNLHQVTGAQIGWYYCHRSQLGVIHEPMPENSGPGDGDTLTAGDFDVIEFDEADNHGRPWWKPNLKPLIRVGGSYQTFLTVEHFPKTGIRFPRSSYLHALLRINTTAVIEWTQHIEIHTPDEAQTVNRRKTKNIRDQIIQRGDDGVTTNELWDKLDATAEYCGQLESNPAERELNYTTIIAVGADDIEVLDDAVTQIRQRMDSVGIVVARRRGTQALLARAFYTGSEHQACLDEFRNPTTANMWSRYLPFITGKVGSARGGPLAIDQTTAHPAIIQHEPEASARHNTLTGIAVVGDPGGGKSHRCKLCALELIMRGGRVVVFEPDLISEWRKALDPFQHLGIRFVDPTTAQWCFDPLLMIPGPEGRDLAADHILGWIGIPADHIQAKRYRKLLRTEDIDSHRALLDHLRAQPGADDDELLTRLESAAEDFPGIFDDTLPIYTPDDCAATVYLTGNLRLPDADEITNAHLFAQMETKRRTGMAVYGLLVDIEQRHMFNRLDRFDWMIFEECADICAWPAGARIVHLITRRGRKHNTGIVLITQDFRDIAKMNDKFIKQKWIFRITDRNLAYQTLQWAGFDVTDPNDGLVTELCKNTSPGNTREHDTEHGEAGAVDRGRYGEGFLVDQLDRRCRCQFFWAPTPEQEQAFDTTAINAARADIA